MEMTHGWEQDLAEFSAGGFTTRLKKILMCKKQRQNVTQLGFSYWS